MTCGIQRTPRNGPADRGFTLIELLVVIAIIALLIGLLLPALSAAQNIATVGRCLGNQHQLGIGVAAYEGDNNGALPGIQAMEGGNVAFFGELGVQYNKYDPPEHDASYYLGWCHGAMIYATLEKSTDAGTGLAGDYPFSNAQMAGMVYSLDDCDGVTGWDWGTTSPNYSPSSTAYSTPVGLGYIGQYLSPYGTMDAVDGRIFYCPGTSASFGTPAYMGDPNIGYPGCGPSVFFPRNNMGANGLYSTFLSDWNKKPGDGGGSAGTAPAPSGDYLTAAEVYQAHQVNPFVYTTYLYRSDEYYDFVDANGAAHTNTTRNLAWGPGVSVFHSMVDTSYPKSDAPFLSGESYVVCNSTILLPFDGDDYRERSASDACHTGQMVNRAFHDGSASTFQVPLGHLPPADDAHGLYEICDGPPGFTNGVWDEGVNDPPSGAFGHYAVWPYYWVVLDNKAPIPPTN